tara:strand:+ start:185 stop:628 length:444 start_codon:yes stop_codon:yes gene_type:complete
LDLLISAIEVKNVEITEICNSKDIPGLKPEISKNKITKDEAAILMKKEGISLSKIGNFDLSKSLKVVENWDSAPILFPGKKEDRIAYPGTIEKIKNPKKSVKDDSGWERKRSVDKRQNTINACKSEIPFVLTLILIVTTPKKENSRQ